MPKSKEDATSRILTSVMSSADIDGTRTCNLQALAAFTFPETLPDASSIELSPHHGDLSGLSGTFWGGGSLHRTTAPGHAAAATALAC